MKMFGFFTSKIAKITEDREKNTENKNTTVNAIDKDSKESRKLIKENRKMLKAKRLDRREAVAMKFGAFRRNVKNLFRYDDQKISDAAMRNSISQKYEAKRKAAGIDKHVAGDARRTSRKEIYKNIRRETSQLGKNHLKASWVNLKHDLKEDRLSFKQSFFEAAGMITAPAKYATDGIVQGAKAVNKTVLRPARAIVKTKAHSYATSSKKYKAGDGLAKNCVRAFREKASTKAKSVGDSIRATAKSAQVSFNKLKANYAKKQASKYAHMFREAQAKTQ